MGLSEDSYTDYRNLRRRVIEPAITLLNLHSEYTAITVSTIKSGRKIVGLHFDYKAKAQQEMSL